MIKIKICGLTNLEDYNLAVSFGADYAGFIFYCKSPRYVTPDAASRIISEGSSGNHLKVGVFVNEKAERIREIVGITGIDIVQLHGDETPQFCSTLGLRYWKAIRVKDPHSIDAISHYSGDVFLLDTFSQKFYGGTGKTFDTEIAGKAIKSGKKIVLAGGITPDNINRFVSLSPYAIDISSGIEAEPGKKDLHKMKKLFNRMR